MHIFSYLNQYLIKNTLGKYNIVFIALLFCITNSQAQSLPISFYGTWDRGGQITNFADPNVDFVLGIEATSNWGDVNPTPGNFDFSFFQQELDKAYANNKLIRFSINVGPDAPTWMYDADSDPNNNPYPQVRKIKTTGGNDKLKWPYYPEYLNQGYKDYYFELIRQFSLFLRNQPQDKFNLVAFVQVKTGCTGDEAPFKGIVDVSMDDISTTDWENFRAESFVKFKQYFNDVPERKIVLTFNNIDPDKEPIAYNYVMTQIDPAIGFGMKGGAFNRGHHLNDEQPYKEQWTPYLINPKQDAVNIQGYKLFAASEMDGTWQNGYFAINPDLGFYWGALAGINVGLSSYNLNASSMDYVVNHASTRETFRMFNRYAQQVYPATATTAFSVFHEGLNAADKIKFPEADYGGEPAVRSNVNRYLAICNSPKYYNRGARVEDIGSVTQGQVYQRANQLYYNDAGWDIAGGNIERFMTQINPDDTSIGLFRVRGTLTASSSKYDRFARSFENSTGKNTMYFQLQNEFPANHKILKFTIIWLDKTAGSTWAFQYRNAAGLQSIPYIATGNNEWKTETITLSDAIMNQGGTLQSDFMLVNTDTTDDIFNGIEMNILGVSKQDQTINFNALPSKTIGDTDFSPSATASSSLTVSYVSSNTAVATIVNGSIHIVGLGTTTITALQAGDETYNAALMVSQDLTVSKVGQTITFNELPSKTIIAADFNPGATASSGLAVSYASSNTAVATIVNGNVHIVGVGPTTITASQTGDETYNAALSMSQDLTVSKAGQTITFNALPSKTVGTADYNPGATASSGLAVLYTSTNTAVATIVNGNIHIVGVGTTTITASQEGNGMYNAAISVSQNLTVAVGIQAIITAEGATTFCTGGSVTLSANTGSGLTYLWSTGAATQSISVTASGSYTVTVTGTGGSTTSAATTVTVNSTAHTTPVTAYKSYTWSAGNGNTYTVAGNYTHVVGCHTETLALSFTSIPPNGSPDLSFCKGTSIASTLGSASLKFYTALTGGSLVDKSLALLGPKIYYVTETKNGVESDPRVARAIVVNNLPATPTALVMTSLDATPSFVIGKDSSGASIMGGLKDLAKITKVGPYMKTEIESILTAPVAATAHSYRWSLPYGVNLVPSNATNLANSATLALPATATTLLGVTTYTDATVTSTLPVIVVKFNTVPAGIGNLVINLYSVSSCGNSATARALTLARALPTAPSKLLLTSDDATATIAGKDANNLPILVGLNTLTKGISKVGPYMGTDKVFTLVATPITAQGVEATSYAWVLPAGVECTSPGAKHITAKDSKPLSGLLPAPFTINDYISTTTSTITVKFSGSETKVTGDLLLSVYAVNGAGNSIARTLKLARALPTAPSKLVLTDAVSHAVVTKADAYTGKGTSLKLTATPFTTQGAEATSYIWVLPAGVNVTDGATNTPDEVSGNKTWTSTLPELTINFKNIGTGVLSIPLNVSAVNGTGTSLAKSLVLKSAVPATPGSITTPSSAVPKFNPTCATITTITVQVPAVAGCTYAWTVASGVERILSGNGTNSIVINVAGVATTTLSVSVVASNGTGSSSAKTLAIAKTTTCGTRIAADEVIATDEFNVIAYPNPSSSEFTIDVQSSAKGATGVQVYDMAGRLIENRQVQSNSVQVGKNYASGIYNVIVNQGANVKTLRVIKR